MKKINLIKGIIICASLTLTSLVPSIANAEYLNKTTDPGMNRACNFDDTSWTGGTVSCYTRYNAGTHCYHRHKNNKTSVYIYNKSGKEASFEISGESFECSWCRGMVGHESGKRKWVTMTDHQDNLNKVKIPAYSARSVYNFIRENGYDYAHLDCTTADTNGVWSPDTSGFVKPANAIITG
ncbi:hypothetical protein [uncultured Ruminococcus sp.]|uniref:hypothetical protein n=1 Tax=uncultured Ruminococcus sp. TaxID=165186 RepID=UPI0025ECD5CC|nr:hypothetical protein [uncultured Ruminococcus sp.]